MLKNYLADNEYYGVREVRFTIHSYHSLYVYLSYILQYKQIANVLKIRYVYSNDLLIQILSLVTDTNFILK